MSTMTMKRSLSLGVLAMILALMAGPAGAAAQRAQATVTIRVSTWDTGTDGLKPYQEGIAAFEKTHPNIKVEVESITNPMNTDLSFYMAKTLTEVAAGSGPDVMLVPDEYARPFVTSGQIIPLDSILRANGVKASDFYTNVWNIGRFNGHQYYVPKDWADLAIYYNKTMFQKAHLPLPKAGWTWSDFLRDARALTITQAGHPVQWGVQLPGDWLRAGLQAFVSSWGGQILSPDGTTVAGYLTSPAAVKAITYYLDLYNKYHISPTPAIVSTFGSLDLFNAQKVAMIMTGPWPSKTYESNPKLSFGVAPMPVGPTGKSVTQPFWAGYAINRTTKHLDAAEQFIIFSASKQWGTIDATWSMPARKDVAQEVSIPKYPILSTFFAQADNVVPLEDTKPLNFTDVSTPLIHMIDTATSSTTPVNVPQLIAQTADVIDANLSVRLHQK
ncbi:MAG TPA: sugar ABC transporter substrate-binding protein [Chloroflexota bacterium]|nr:sugar ABC transporter substrate-binding protein [Chloroflexota bacterium]